MSHLSEPAESDQVVALYAADEREVATIAAAQERGSAYCGLAHARFFSSVRSATGAEPDPLTDQDPALRDALLSKHS